MTLFKNVEINCLEEGNRAYELTQSRLSDALCSVPLKVLEPSSLSGQLGPSPFKVQ